MNIFFGNLNEPKLTEPIVFIDETNHLTMYSDDKFASLGWRYIGEKNWRIYSRKIKIKKSKDIQCLASRIGYESNIITIQRE